MGSLWPDFAKKPDPALVTEVFSRHFDRHQRIDRLTDQHPLLEPIRKELRPIFRKTTPLIVDVMLDHHLALNWPRYHDCSLKEFATRVYGLMFEFSLLALPERLQRTRYWMQRQNWLLNYQTQDGIERALDGLSQRLRFANPIAANKAAALSATVQFANELEQFIHFLFVELKRTSVCAQR